jgi:hypothetical protein
MTARPRRMPTSIGLDVRHLFAKTMTEAELDESVRTLARWLCLRCYSVRNSRAGVATSAGFPDLVLCGPGGVLFRELKRQDGKLRPEQQQWGDALLQAGADWRAWRPGDLIDGTIERELRRLAT